MSNNKLDAEVSIEGGVKIFKRSTAVNLYRVQFDTEITNSYNYAELINLLKNASKNDVFEFVLQNFGGSCHSCVGLVNVMKECEANILCEVIGPCYSAGSTIALAGTGIRAHPDSLLMFHNFSTIQVGKANEIEISLDASKKWIHSYMKRNHMPFLTEKECDNLIKGQDLYVYTSDKDFKKRCVRHFK